MSRTTAPSVGLLGDHDAVADAIESAGGRPTVLDAADVADADLAFLITVRESELLAAVRAGVDVPTLPFEAGRAVRSVPGMAVEPAIANLVEGRYDPVPYPVLSVESPLGTARALQDVMLVTAEPARISEYVVRSGDEQVGRFRADGVVVATPAGSQGYSGSAGGPVTHPDADVLTVVPIAPFATDQDDWVLPMDGLELAVARDETPVELLADDRTVGTVVEGDAATLDRDGSLTVAVVTASYGVFG